MPVCIPMREMKGVGLGGWGSGENLEGIGEEETTIKIYCVIEVYFH